MSEIDGEEWDAEMNGVIDEHGETLNGHGGRVERVETALQVGKINVPLMFDAVNKMFTGKLKVGKRNIHIDYMTVRRNAPYPSRTTQGSVSRRRCTS